MILHIPHASQSIPDSVRDQFPLTDQELNEEMIRMTDSHTGLLFHAEGAVRVVFPVNRLVVDPERFADDGSEPMASKGMGVIYTLRDNGEQLRRKLTIEERQELLQTFYWPHHQLLSDRVKEELEQRGRSLIVDCHSFPDRPFRYEQTSHRTRPLICIGSDTFHTPVELVEALEREFVGRGYSVGINDPFAGSLVPLEYYQIDANVTSVMIEVNRSLFMDEQTGDLLPEKFATIKADLTVILQSIAEERWRQT